MILLAYIIIGHPEWKGCEIEIFAAFEKAEISKQVGRLNHLIEHGRIPISQNKVQRMPWNKRAKSYESLVCENSDDADLVISRIFGQSLVKMVIVNHLTGEMIFTT